ncbi:MAG: hypothetical protein ACE366_17210 [Bradymonadia bacterium]
MMRRKDLIRLVSQFEHLIYGPNPEREARLQQLDRRGLEEAMQGVRRAMAVAHFKTAEPFVKLSIGLVDAGTGEPPVTKLD